MARVLSLKDLMNSQQQKKAAQTFFVESQEEATGKDSTKTGCFNNASLFQ